jgi:hypothetical protein
MTTIILDHQGRIISGQMKGIDLSKPDKLSISGVPINVSAKDAKRIGSGEVALRVGITYRKSHRDIDIIGEGVKLHKATIPKATGLTAPVYDKNGGNASAYYLMGRVWKAPGILPVVMSLKDDAILAATGMAKDKVLGAIGAACAEWNRCTSGKPFSEKAVLTTKQNWKYDGVNNGAFQPGGATCSALAWTGCWYKTQGIPVGTMYPLMESDMVFNSNLKWGLGEVGKLDFQSVVLHELGHTLGLGDLYGKAAFKADTQQVMHYYTGVKRVLGNGDAAGVWRLYG